MTASSASSATHKTAGPPQNGAALCLSKEKTDDTHKPDQNEHHPAEPGADDVQFGGGANHVASETLLQFINKLRKDDH